VFLLHRPKPILHLIFFNYKLYEEKRRILNELGFFSLLDLLTLLEFESAIERRKMKELFFFAVGMNDFRWDSLKRKEERI